MKTKVLHFIRKRSQLKASFIQNQIKQHVDFSPSVVYKFNKYKNNDGGFAEINLSNLKEIDLSQSERFLDKLIYTLFKKISKKQTRIIEAAIKENNIKILHFHYGTDASLFLPCLKKIRIPKVVSFYGYDCSSFPKKFGGFGSYFLKKRVFKYVDRVFAMSEDMKQDLIKAGCPEEKIIVHYYGTDTERFVSEHNYNKETKSIIFLIISGLTPQKGHVFLLRAFEKAHQINSNIRLTIVGEGPTRQIIEETIQKLKMNNYVSIKPFVVYGSKEHKMYLKKADVFIHPSVTDINGDKEGIPGAVVEAMAAGLPVISTYHAGIPNIIENGKTGLLVKEWDVNGLRDAILFLSKNQEKRKELGLAAQSHALNDLDLLKKEKELEDIYKQLLILNEND